MTLFSLSPSFEPAQDAGAVADVYRIGLTVGESTRSALRALLSDDERARADRFRDAVHGMRFTAARGALRLILGRYANMRAELLGFTYGSKGKPALAGDGPSFNVSHSADLALVAVIREGTVGIDVEHYRDELEDQKLARRFFSPGELSDLGSLAGEQWRDGFYTCWTRKEAYMKAVGDGFSIPLNTFRVSVLPGEPPALLEVQSNPAECGQWVFQDVDVPETYRACVVTNAPARELRHFDLLWSQEAGTR